MASLLQQPGTRAAANVSLAAFDAGKAPLVVSWVSSEDELFRLSPRTPAPLTEKKVLEWRVPGGHAFLCLSPDADSPCGYAELNPMPTGEGQWWLGHCLVAPQVRGQGLGGQIVSLLLKEAFERRNAEQVCLVVFPDNHSAVRCYERVGFVGRQLVYRTFETRPGRHRMIYMTIDRETREKGVRMILQAPKKSS